MTNVASLRWKISLSAVVTDPSQAAVRDSKRCLLCSFICIT